MRAACSRLVGVDVCVAKSLRDLCGGLLQARNCCGSRLRVSHSAITEPVPRGPGHRFFVVACVLCWVAAVCVGSEWG